MSNKRYTLKKLQPTASPSLAIDYQRELNEAQYAAATTLEGPLLVIAGAGSGKTRTLIYRVARLIEAGVAPQSILLLTFTRRAAQEMLRRASILMDNRCEQVAGGTFHSVANLILRKYAATLGLDPSFTILDRTDSEDVINLLRAMLGFNDRARRFPKKQTIAEIFSKSVNKVLSLDEVILQFYSHFADHLEDLKKLLVTYHQYKDQKALVDYDDLLVKFRDLLADHQAVSRQLSETYRYIMVDEYQDTNKIQAEIVRLMAVSHNNVMVVGDDSQSIYSFRGAHFRNIMDFPQQFSGARIFTLEENYRSTQPILDLANAVISRAEEKYPKRLFTRKNQGPIPVLIQAEDERAQSRFVCQKVLELREEGVPLHEIAVLFRSSFLSFDLEIELTRHNLPYVKRGGFKFMETAHVKDVLAHLRVIANPRDSVSWNRLLLLIDGIGPRTSQSIIGAVMASISRAGNFLEGLKTFGTGSHYSLRLQELYLLLEKLSNTGLAPAEQVAWVCHYYLPILKQRYDDYPKRIKDLEHLQTLAERYKDIGSLLSDLALAPPDESVSEISSPEDDDERLILSTIHSAKGLEWHTVFILCALDGRLPSLHSFMSNEELEEERRLIYVAITRAKENLFITYPIKFFDRATGSVLSKPSRFIDEIAEGLLETWALVEEG
jgi:DNA helicase-2/ATP-dependent DNA helicase PcrA